MSQIQLSDLTFSYEGSCHNVFEHLDLTLDTDWRCGLCGRNGRGKSTLLKLIAGELSSGAVTKSVPCRYFPGSPPGEWTASMLAPPEDSWRLARELSLLGLSEEMLWRPLATLSPGERTKVQLAALFLEEDAFPLIDEPTNHLDGRGREQVAAYLRGKRGFLLVSHDRAFLDGCVDHIVSLGRSEIEVSKGTFSQWYERFEARNEAELAQNRRLRGEIDRLSAAARRTSGWADAVERSKKGTKIAGLRPDRGAIGHKAAKMMKRAKAVEARRERAAEEKRSLLREIEQQDTLMLRPLPWRGELLSAREFTLSYGERPLFAPLSFALHPGERVALAGGNGSGKSSLLRAVAAQRGLDTPPPGREGMLTLASGVVLSYLPQGTDKLRGTPADYAERCGLDRTDFFTLLRKLGLPREQFEKELSAFSDGQKKKVLLARSLAEAAHLYLWDEPLNFLDLFARMQLEEMLLSSGATLLFVEHDAAFCKKIATGRIEL